MQAPKSKNLLLAMAVAGSVIAAQSASAAIIISEVDANGSSARYGGDWFELTNTGSAAVDITGSKMDDNSNLFANAVALRGVTSIAAGQSVVFIEGNSTGTTDATIDASFKSAWFGANVPAGLTIGNYGGSGVGVSQNSDAVNIFDASGTLVTRVDFLGSTSTGDTFDNAAGLNNVTLSNMSVAGTNGAFTSLSGGEIGSPGVAPVPLPAAGFLLLSGLGAFMPAARRRRNGV